MIDEILTILAVLGAAVIMMLVIAGAMWASDMAKNAPHEGPGAASSRTVPLDAVVGRQRKEK